MQGSKETGLSQSAWGRWLLLQSDPLRQDSTFHLPLTGISPSFHLYCYLKGHLKKKKNLQYRNCYAAFNQFLLQQLICCYTESQDILHYCLHFFLILVVPYTVANCLLSSSSTTEFCLAKSILFFMEVLVGGRNRRATAIDDKQTLFTD